MIYRYRPALTTVKEVRSATNIYVYSYFSFRYKIKNIYSFCQIKLIRHDSRPEATPGPSVLDTELQEAGEGLYGVRQGCDSEMLHPYWLPAQVSWANKKGRLLKSQPFSVYLGG